MISKRPEFTGLTGLRGVGAIWVLAYHAQVGTGIPIARAGYLGVDLFFMLSGFVLSHAHSDLTLAWRPYLTYLRARFARIFPMHWTALALSLAIVTAMPRIVADMPHLFRWPDLLSVALLVQNWGFGIALAWNTPAWSLSTEWLMSFCFPFILVCARQIVSIRAAGLVCAFFLLAFAFLLIAIHRVDPNVQGRAGIIRTALEFSTGCFLYRIREAGGRVPGILVLGAIALIVAGVLAPSLATLAVFGFPVIVLAASERTTIARVLSHDSILFTGRISYSIYLLHWILWQVSTRLHSNASVSGLAGELWFCGYFGSVVLLSAASFRWIETPARQFLRGKVEPPGKAAAPDRAGRRPRAGRAFG